MAPRRRQLVATLDVLAIVLGCVALAIALTGGFVLMPGGVRVSLKNAWRPLLLCAAVISARLATDRSVGPLGFSREQWRGLLLPVSAEPVLMPVPPGRWRRAVVAAAAMCLILAFLAHRQVLHPYAVPDFGDPLFSMWRMAWVPHQLFRDPRHLFDGNIFYNEPLTLTLSDSMILPALTAAPLLAAGVHPVVAYTLLLLSGFLLSGMSTYLLVERLTGSARAAFVSGLMYAFYPYRFEHYSHLELQMTEWMPLGLLALHWLISTGRGRYLFALALALVAQLYSSMYYAVFFLLYVVPVSVVLLLAYRPPLRRLVLPAAAAAILALACTVPLGRAYRASQSVRGERPIAAVMSLSATPTDYLRADRRSALWGSRMLSGRRPERALFPGVTPLGLAAVGLAPPIGAVRLAYAAGLAAAFDGSLGFHGYLYPYLYKASGVIRGLRVPARFSVITGLTLVILGGFGARRLLDRCRTRAGGALLFGALVAAVMIDMRPALELHDVWKTPPPIYDVLANTPGSVLAEFPISSDPENFVENTPYMYFALWHWRPMTNGYSGFMPQAYEDLVMRVRGFPDPGPIAALRARGVTHVSINCALVVHGTCAAWLERMEKSADLRLLIDTRWQGAPVRLYELVSR